MIDEMGGVDIVLDDGSHIGRHQKVTFDVIFPLLSEDGLFVIEDLHTAYWPDFEGGLRRSGTGIEIMKQLVDEMHRQYYKTGKNRSKEIFPIESIQFFDSIACVHKKTQDSRRYSVVPGQ